MSRTNSGLNRREFLGAAGASAAALATGTLANQRSSSAAPSLQDQPSGKLTVMIWGSPVDLQTQQDAFADYNKAFPNVEIEVLTGDCGWNTAACKVNIAGGTMADIFVPFSGNYEELILGGILTDLGPYIERDAVNLADFHPKVAQGITSVQDGKIYGLPMGFNIQSFYYNTAMFDAAGLAYPPNNGDFTWDDVVAWAKKLTIDENGNTAESPDFDPDKIKQWGFTSFNTYSEPPAYEPVLRAFGGSTMQLPDRQTCNIESPETISGWQFMQDIMWKHRVAVTPQDDQEQLGYLRWVDGQVAMQVLSHEQVDLVAANNPGMPFDMAALPKGPAGNATVLQIHFWSIFSGSENKDLAWHLVKWLATAGQGLHNGRTQMSLIPAYKDLAQGPAFLQREGEPAHVKEAQLDPLDWEGTTIPSVYNQKYNELRGEEGYGPAVEDIRLNEKPVADALAGVCERIEEIMSR